MGIEIDRLEVQIEAQVTKDNNQLDDLIKKLDRVSDSLSNLAVQETKVDTAGSSGNNSVAGAGDTMSKTSKKASGLSSVLGSLFQRLSKLKGSVDMLWNSVESSMNYMKTLNDFNAAYGLVADAAVSQWQDAGYASADEYYQSFSDRAKGLTSKMTGFSVNDDGTLTADSNAGLGIDLEQVMSYQAIFAQLSGSMGVASETALKLSQALTEIGADLASVKGMDFDTVWADMASGLAGTDSALEKYGAEISNVNLQQKLTELGIDANVTALDRSDSALLRAIILLDSTRYAWGNLADTLNQPSIQLRLLESNFANLSRAIGSLFLPLVSKVLPYVNGLVIAVQRLVTWVGSLLGIDLSKISSGIGGASGLGDLTDDTADLTDGLDEAEASAKKLKSNLQGFDELNVITSSDDSGSSAGTGAGLPSGALDTAFDDMFSEYQAAWDEAYAQMENRAKEFADKVEKALQPIKDIIGDFAVGNFFKAGQDTSNLVVSIIDFFSRAIDAVDWYGIGAHIGEFLAGVDWTAVLGSVGHLIWEALEAALELWSGALSTAPIETALISMVAISKLLKTITESKFVTGFKNMANNIKSVTMESESATSNLTALQKGAITAVAGFVEFTVVSNTFEGLVDGSENLVAGIAKIGGAVGGAAVAMYAALGPAGIAVAGVTALTAALIGLDEGFIKAKVQAEEIKQLEHYGDTLENIAQKAKDFSDAIIQSSEERQDYINDIKQTDIGYLEALKTEYENLSSKITLTADEESRLKIVSGELVEQLPELEGFYNSETGFLEDAKQAVDELIASKEKELMLNAINDGWADAIKDELDAQIELNRSTEGLLAAQEELAAIEKEIAEYREGKSDGEVNVERYQRDMQTAYFAVESWKTAVEESAEALEAVQNEISDYESLYSEISQGMFDNGKDSAFAAGQEKGESYGEGILAGKSVTVESAEEIVNAADAALQSAKSGEFMGIGENIAEGILDPIENADTEEGVTGFFDSICNWLIEIFGIHSPAKEMNPFGEYIGLGILEGIENIGEKFYAVGQDMMWGIYDGIISMETVLYGKAAEIANNIAETVKTAVFGEYIMDGYQLQCDIAPVPQFSSAGDYSNYAFSAEKYNNYSYYDSPNNYDAAETNMLLRQLIGAVKEEKVIQYNGKVIGKAVRDEDMDFYRRTGKGMFQH